MAKAPDIIELLVVYVEKRRSFWLSGKLIRSLIRELGKVDLAVFGVQLLGWLKDGAKEPLKIADRPNNLERFQKALEHCRELDQLFEIDGSQLVFRDDVDQVNRVEIVEYVQSHHTPHFHEFWVHRRT